MGSRPVRDGQQPRSLSKLRYDFRGTSRNSASTQDHRDMADTAGPAVGSTRSRLTQNGQSPARWHAPWIFHPPGFLMQTGSPLGTLWQSQSGPKPVA
jgi:hypothetical protein